MTEPAPQAAVETSAGHRYLYLAVPLGGHGFKLGISVSVTNRLRALGISQLDFDQSLSMAGRSSDISRAEKALHFLLETWRSPHPDGKDGHTEWFAMEGLETARRYVIELVERDSRFSLSDLQTALSAAEKAQDEAASLSARRHAAQVRRGKELNERLLVMPQTLVGMMERIHYLCDHALGVVRNQPEGDAICFDRLSETTYEEVSALLPNAAIKGEHGLSLKGIMGINVIASGRWSFNENTGFGAGFQNIRHDGLIRMADALAKHQDSPGVDPRQVDLCLDALRETHASIEEHISGLPSLPRCWLPREYC